MLSSSCCLVIFYIYIYICESRFLDWCDTRSSSVCRTVCIPDTCWKNGGLECGTGRPCYVPALGRVLTNKDVFWENGRLCGCLGGAVVSKLTAHQEGLSSSPRFFGPLGKFAWACVGFLLFPPTVLKTCTLGDSKSLPGVSVCVCPAMNWARVFLLLTEGPC